MTEALYWLQPVLSLLVGAVTLQIIGLVTGGLTFDRFGDAFLAVLVASLVGWVGVPALSSVWFSPSPTGSTAPNILTAMLSHAGFWFVFNVISLAVAGLVISGMHIRGVFGLVLAAAALTAVIVAVDYIPVAIQLAGQ